MPANNRGLKDSKCRRLHQSFFRSLWFGSTMDSALFTFILYKGKYFSKEFSLS